MRRVFIDGQDQAGIEIPQSIKIISKKEDFPAPVDGVIYLENLKTYVISSIVDVQGLRFHSDGVVTFSGYGPETCWVKSTGLASGTPLITATNTLALNQVTLEHATILDLDGDGNAEAALDWTGVNFRNATTAVGVIKNYNNLIANKLGFLNAGGLTIDGTIGTVAFVDTLFENAPGLTSIIVADTAIITRRIRIEKSAFISLSGETALDVSEDATIPNESYILDWNNFSGGGTYVTGIQRGDARERWEDNRGIENGASVAQYYMASNATATTISVAGAFTKVLGATSAGDIVSRFNVSDTNNRAVYLGVFEGFFRVSAIISFTSGVNNVVSFQIGKNGTPSAPSNQSETANGTRNANITVEDVFFLQLNDYIELFTTNESNTQDVTVTDLSVVLERITN